MGTHNYPPSDSMVAGDIIHEQYRLIRKLGQAYNRQSWLVHDLRSPLDTPVVLKLLLGDEHLQ